MALQMNRFFSLFIMFTVVIAPTARGQREDVISSIDQMMTKGYPEDKPGAAILVAQGDKIIFKKGYGKASLKTGIAITPQHVFRIGSITKQFTSVAIMKLASEGMLKLEDKVSKYLPDYKPQGELITIQNLLNHTSGIPNFTSLLPLRSLENKSAAKSIQQRFNDFNTLSLEFSPGEKQSYSNSGYFVLGMIIEKVSGVPYGEYIEKNFFRPLKMKSSFYDGGSTQISNKTIGYLKSDKGLEEAPFIHHSMPFAAGALASTVEDLWKWNQAVFNYRLVPKSIIEAAWQSTTLKSGTKLGYGYGWRFGRIDDLKVIDHGGAIDGYVGYALYVPDENLFVCILTNMDDFASVFQSYNIARLVLNRPIKNPEAVPMTEESIKEYTGNYQINSNRDRRIFSEGPRLYSQETNGEKEELFAFKKDGFFIRDSPGRFEFKRNANNQIEAVEVGGFEWESEVNIKSNDVPAKEKIAIPMNSTTFDEFVGEYEIAPGFIVKVWRESTVFMAQASGDRAIEIHPENDHKFFIKGINADLEFLREEANKVTSVIVTFQGKTNKGKKIK
jgi:CubicO group peptidase (beta-lactamase class C family)